MRIKIEQYQQAADEKVSLGGIKWLNKWDVCVQCDSREEAEALKARLAEHEQCVPLSEYKKLQRLTSSQGIRLMEYESQPDVSERCFGKMEPVAWMLEWSFNGEETGQRLYDDERHCLLDAQNYGGICRPLYTATPQRKWQGLTTAERKVLWTLTKKPSEYAELIEAKLKEKNHE